MTVKSGGEVFGMPVPPRVVGANLHLHAGRIPEARVAEVLNAQAPYQIQCSLFLVETWTRRAQLNGGRDLSINENAVAIERDSENGCNSLYTCDTDTVVGCEVSQTVGDQPLFVALHAADDMRSVVVTNSQRIVRPWAG